MTRIARALWTATAAGIGALALGVVAAHPAVGQAAEAAAGQAAAEPASLEQETVERTYAFDRDGAFRIMLLEGSVVARVWDRDSLRVVARLDEAARRGLYVGVAANGEGGKMGIEGGGRGDVEVTLPRGATLWVKTAGASIDVAGIAGSLDVYSVTGDITIDGSPRSLHAESMGGRVRLTGDPGVARVRTGAGAIEVRGGGRDLTLSSVTGRIDVVTGRPLRSARVETVSGPVVIRTALETGSTLAVTSHDGPVELALPPGTSAEFVVATLEGELRNTLTDRGARKATGLRGRELTFSTGVGGAEVTVRTFSGDVVVRPRD